MSIIAENQDLKKSIRAFRFYIVAFLISMFTISFLGSVNDNSKIVYDAFIALPFFIIFIIEPVEKSKINNGNLNRLN